MGRRFKVFRGRRALAATRRARSWIAIGVLLLTAMHCGQPLEIPAGPDAGGGYDASTGAPPADSGTSGGDGRIGGDGAQSDVDAGPIPAPPDGGTDGVAGDGSTTDGGGDGTTDVGGDRGATDGAHEGGLDGDAATSDLLVGADAVTTPG